MFYIDYEGAFRYNKYDNLFGIVYVIEYLKYADRAHIAHFDMYIPVESNLSSLMAVFILVSDCNGDDVL